MKKILLAGILALCFSNLVFAQDPFERDSVFQSKDLSVKQIYDGLKNGLSQCLCLTLVMLFKSMMLKMGH